MVRRGRWLALAAAAAVAGCGDDGGGATTTTAAPVEDAPVTIPSAVDPGRGFLLLGEAASVLTVTSCQLDPVTDPDTGVTTEVAVAAQDAAGRTVDVVRASFEGDVRTVTDTITIADASGAALESMRADRDGLFIDLRVPTPVGPLIDVDAAAATVRADGVFGPVGGGADDPANVDGELLLRCP
jgi:hypothetical protein